MNRLTASGTMFTYNLTVILSHNTKQCVEQELENQVKTGSASCSVLPVQKQRNRLLCQLKRFQFEAKRKVFKWLLNMHHASPLGQLYGCHPQSPTLRQNCKRAKQSPWSFSGVCLPLSRTGGTFWIMQAGKVGNAEGKDEGKCCSTAADHRETSSTDRD